MLRHPDTLYTLETDRYQNLRADGDRARLAGLAGGGRAPLVRLALAGQRVVGAALVSVGQRGQGTPPSPPSGDPSPAGSVPIGR